MSFNSKMFYIWEIRLNLGGNSLKTKKPRKLGAKRFGKRNTAYLLADIIIVNLVYFLTTTTYWIFRTDAALIRQLALRIPYVTLVYVLCYAIFRVYQTAWRYAGLADMAKYFVSAGVGTCGVWVCDYILMKTNRHLIANGTASTLYFNVLPKTVYLDSLLIIILFCLTIRLASRSYLMFKHERNRKMHLAEMKQILIIGAGEAGTSLIRDFENNSYKFGNPAALIDDDKSKIGLLVNGVPVVGNCDDIERVCADYSIDEIIFCIPSITDDRKREILNGAIKTGIPVKIAPDIADLENSRISYKEMRSVDILDLLSRPEIKLNPDICKYVTDKTVLVTGGGGSIGSELCRQIARYNPEKIVIFDIYENNAYALKNSLDLHYFGNPKIEIRVGSVREYARLKEVFEEFHPSSVFHAAAHKHVPLMEDSP